MELLNINISKTKKLIFQKVRMVVYISYFISHISYLTTFAQNALINEKSPYLLQHAHNPVNWQAWDKQAKNTDKLLIISIGYAACHWCHVMEKESFSDVEVAKLMNQHFTNIKIDREERPDIDQIYMTACQLTNANGCGWPLNVIALPDGKPVWIGSFQSKEKWTETLNYFLNVQKNQSGKLKQYAEHLKQGIEDTQKLSGQTAGVSLLKIVENIKTELDFKNGGLLETPKFPMPSLFGFLLKYENQNPDLTLKKGIATTLNRMASGGIYDHLAGGFSRYSTDSVWGVPHFEKMLYDNAQLVSLYARASKENPHYQQIVRETIEFLEQNLQDKSGGFYASLDADSEGQEGKYYTWTKTEIEQILGIDSHSFWRDFDLKEGVLDMKYEILDMKYGLCCSGFKIPNSMVSDGSPCDLKSDTAIKKLAYFRQNRTKPATDTKIITAWNVLMLKGYIDAYRFLDDETYLLKAKNLANYILKNHFVNGQLRRVNYQNTNGFLDDYAYTASALVALYQVTFDMTYLNQANTLIEQVLKNFKQNEQGLFYYSTQPLFSAPIEVADGVMPSANAILAEVLNDLGVFLENENYTQTSQKMTSAMQQKISSAAHSSSYYYWVNVLSKQQKPPFEVCIVGKNAHKVAKEFKHFDNILLMAATNTEPLPLLKNKLQKGKTMIYICRNKVCKMPTTSLSEAIKTLEL